MKLFKKQKKTYDKLRVVVIDPDLGFDVRWIDNRIESLYEINNGRPLLGTSIKGTNLIAQSTPSSESDNAKPTIEIEGNILTGVVIIVANESELGRDSKKIVSISAEEVQYILKTFKLK